ncbi:MAG: phytanoyl-CoA dioxygenase family protein [Acidobacteriota bacterium]|nr:phytanoyl-CoA dioxygenase family protein [Acidobacteriota bacterium]
MLSQTSNWPSQDDIAHFEEYGWVTSPRLLPEDLLDEAAEAVEAYYLGERDHLLPLQGGFLDWRPEHGDGLRLNDYVSLQSDSLRKLVCWPELGRAAAALMGAGQVRLFHDQLITKPPASLGVDTTIGWHTDKSYWKTCSSERMLTAWIPLQDCAEPSGPLAVVDRSHRWEGTDWMTTFVLQDLASIESRLGRPINARPLLLRRGQVSFHHARTIHGSLPNRTETFRTALTVHLQDGDNRYQRFVDEGGRLQVHVNDVLCRRSPGGDPDYADPSICPALWPIR